MPHREGLACAGNWIIDHYPKEEGLAFIFRTPLFLPRGFYCMQALDDRQGLASHS
jgi:hypothetical protein